MAIKHFLHETDFSASERQEVFELARQFKRLRNRGTPPSLDKQTWGLLFFKNSTRTRVSFEVGIHELGGNALYLDRSSMQLSRGESVSDTAKTLSRYIHGLAIRAYEHGLVEDFAREGQIPVINALTDFLHPCQAYTDLFTLAEKWAGEDGNLPASLKGRKLCFLGDTACNMANSLSLAGALFGMEVVLSGPEAYRPSAGISDFIQKHGLSLPRFTSDPVEAIQDSDAVYTDVWVSMGDEEEADKRLATMRPYSVTMDLFNQAKPEAWFLHCMPAHPGEEVSQDVLNSPRAILFDQAENRLHIQKAILAILALGSRDSLLHS